MAKLLAIFDLDGTLVDTPSGIVRAFGSVLRDNALDAVDETAIRHTIGLPLEVAFTRLMGMAKEDPRIPALVSAYQQAFREQVLPIAPQLVFAGVIDGLEKLRASGVTLAVATSKVSKSAFALLDAAGLLHYFAKVLGADDVANPKPHPEMALTLMAAFQTPASSTCMVGDTTHDLQMARQAGIHGLGVTWGVHGREQLEQIAPLHIATQFDQTVETILSLQPQPLLSA
ncbi:MULTISPECIES: HAD family hydrolase [Tenebrionibacter/Tenebrionicola group]|jgi:phosphoglycolate phosphatase|uniref:HAD family hydrolase n=2 Tax=Tenebrionibacter/Tenebrionicola group TaxID=2969848 RepID=A0A8K0XXE6_9ENTR|nr:MULTISPECIES: HAD family hydrolase [Tenebrionibacter/Tenebrionicola group]MBK4715608.1 HAD family hydrolase [Tenebrionibacter intestinalis]MBV4412914.1 HAD family hydrolase [Tenebrionicola larvae]MBV5094608.1 HAD family hydrolase [Tenebrionicola larvae]